MTDHLSAEPQAPAKVVAITPAPAPLAKKAPKREKLQKVEPPPDSLLEQAVSELTPLYKTFTQADKSFWRARETHRSAAEQREAARVALGTSLLKWREKYYAPGSHGGKGFAAVLDRAGIPKATAYRYIKRLTQNADLGSNETRLLPSAKPTKRLKPVPAVIDDNGRATAEALMKQVDCALDSLAALDPAARNPSDYEKLKQWCLDMRGKLREIETRFEPEQEGQA
jgi:hypothetical protein